MYKMDRMLGGGVLLGNILQILFILSQRPRILDLG
jgi:hypothetical protein